jgi:hypothetical protein
MFPRIPATAEVSLIPSIELARTGESLGRLAAPTGHDVCRYLKTGATRGNSHNECAEIRLEK